MTPEDKERLEACIAEAADILYRNTSSKDLELDFEMLEKTIRDKICM